MCSTVDDSMQCLDFGLLFGSAPTLTENTSIIEDVYGNQNLLESPEQDSVQNERNVETTINYKAEYLKILRCLEEKNKDYDQIRRWLEEKNNDYDQLKQQFNKVGQDYVELYYESSKNALDAINANTSLDKITEELKICQLKMNAIENQYSVTSTMHKAALSNNNQLTKFVEKLESDATNLKDMNQSYKEAIKEEKRNNSTLKYKLNTYEEELCSIAGKLDRAIDKKNRDRETQRQITKYMKKKFNADLENIDSESVDTGRGSSFSNYSPAYSINFSPLNMTENFEQKLMKDASTSPLQTNETFNLSKLLITSPSFDVGTKPLKNKSVNVDSSKENIETVDTASSPISFLDDIKITTVDTATSPISFDDNSAQDMAKTKSTDIAFNSFSGIKSPLARTKMIHLDCSPKSMDIAINPIYVANPSSSPPMSPSWESTASPIEFTPLKYADVTIPAIEITDITRPLEPASVTSPVVQAPEMSRPFKPAAVTSPVVQAPEMARPFNPAAVTSPVVQTPQITRPFKPAAATSPVVQTEMTRPFKPAADFVENRSLDPTVAPRPTVKIAEMTMQLKPTAVTKHAYLLTGPNDTNDVKRQSLAIKISEMARPIETTDFVNQEAKTTTSEHVISLVNKNLSVISKTTDLGQVINAANVRRSVIQTPSRPMKYADAKRPLIKTKTPDKTKQNENIKIFSSEKSLNKPFKEIQSHLAQDQEILCCREKNQERDDLEVRMILNKFRLDWNALSPMSITPDLDEEGLVQSKSDVRNDETERQSSEHSRSQISKESDSLFVITPDYKKLTIPQNKCNTLKHQINEDNPSQKNKIPKPHSIPPIRHTSVYNENERQSDKTIHLRNRKAPVIIYEKNTKSNNEIEMPQSLTELASTLPSRNQLTESQESVKKEKELKEKHIDCIVSKTPERLTSDRIKSTIPAAQSKTKSEPETQTKVLLSPIDNMSISKELQSNTRITLERRRSERIKSTIPAAQSKANSVPQTQTKLQSSPIDNMSNSKEPQSNTCIPPARRRSGRIKSTIPAAQSKTQSVPQTQTKLQSSPIDNMSIPKEPQSNTRKPPERRRSERIRSTNPVAQSKMKSVPQTQTKLLLSPIDNMSISKEPQSNTRSGCPPIISNPEFGRKRTICRSMEAQSDNNNSKRQKNSEYEASKLNSAEICCEDKFTYSYSNPLKKRISRVIASDCNTISVLNNYKSENISDRKATETINKDHSYAPAFKLADDKTGLFIKPGQNMNENDNTKMSITHASTKPKIYKPEANLKSTTTAVPYKNHPMAVSEIEQSQNEDGRYCADYSDIDLFNPCNNNLKTHINKINKKGTYECTHNQLDIMIVQYGSKRKNMNKSSITNKAKYEYQIAKEIEKAVAVCVNVSANPDKYSKTLQEVVAELKKHSDISSITSGLYRYLNSNDRKREFLPGNKNMNYNLKPTPTKYVVSLMQIIDNIDKNGLKLWEHALDTCRYLLFRLGKGATTSLDVVESVTHLFVNMCQYNGRRNSKSVVLFMLAAMYCANYKAIIIIKNCLDLVPEILPHEHEMEKTLHSMNPLLQIFIFLLHFYNCKDQHGKVHNLRYTLKKRYGYDPTQENDTTILFMVKQTVMKINDHYLDNNMLEYAILILAKRKGTMWCHKNIIQKIILPIIKGEIYASKAAFRFCLTIITKLVKPYNKEMTVHSVEVVNLLMEIIEQPHPQEMKEDIICGLMCLNMENVIERINTFLANWNPPSISPKLEKALKKYIERKPYEYWMYRYSPSSTFKSLHPHCTTNNRNVSSKGNS